MYWDVGGADSKGELNFEDVSWMELVLARND
jgi:hypothetical protein